MKYLAVIIVLLLVVGLIIWIWRLDFSSGQTEFGLTYSAKYAQELSLNPEETLNAILTELPIKYLRLVAYWDEIEKNENTYDFSNLDWQLQQAQVFSKSVVLALGTRVPRWPECHFPVWAKSLSEADRQAAVNKFIAKTVSHFKNSPVIISWQVENEPFLDSFAKCPKQTKESVEKEIAIVRSYSSLPITITDSGELSWWLKVGKITDILGTSVYRRVWNPIVGAFDYPLPPAYYAWKANLIKKTTGVKEIFISELQMEPWSNKSLITVSLAQQYLSFDARQFQKNAKYIKQTGLNPVYLWGAEWWYWLKKQGQTEIWELAKNLH